MREQIIQAAADVIQHVGFKKLTMDDIASKLRMSKKTLYKIFKNKEELICEVIKMSVTLDKRRTIEAINTENTWLGKLRAAVLFHFVNEIPIQLADELKYFYPEEWMQVHALYDFKKKTVQQLLKDGIRNKQISTDISIEIIMLILDKSIPALLSYEFLANNHFNLNQAIDQIIHVLFYGIINR